MKNLKIEKVPSMVIFNRRHDAKTIVTMQYDIVDSDFIIPTLQATLKNHRWTVYISGIDNNVNETETKTTKEVYEIVKKYGFA